MHRLYWSRERLPSVAVVLLLGAVLAIAAPSLAFAFGETVAAGTVRDGESATAIAGASISAYAFDAGMGDWSWVGDTTSAANGTFALTDESVGIGAGDYRIYASAPGYVSQLAERTWDGGAPMSVDFNLAAVLRDSYEPDDSAVAATMISPGAAAQIHSFAPAADVDWVTFEAQAGALYTIETISHIWGETDTYVVLYDSDGTTVLAENDDWSGAFSRVTYIAATTRTLYAMVRHAEADGTGMYGLTLTEEPAPGTIASGTVTDAVSGAGLAGAQVTMTWFELGVWAPVGATTAGADGTYTLIDQIGNGAGTYRVYVSAASHESSMTQRVWNGVDALLLDFPLQPVAADVYEPDDTVGQARAIAKNGEAEKHSLYPAGDQDWVTFTTVAGMRYLIDTTAFVAGTTDTRLTLYGPDGTTMLADNDDYGSDFSHILWEATSAQTLYAMVRHGDGSTVTGAYQLTVQELAGDPLVASGTVTDGLSGAPVAGAQVTAYYNDPGMGLFLIDQDDAAADGTFSIFDRQGYGSGEYLFEVAAAGYDTASVTRTWDGNSMLTVNVALLGSTPNTPPAAGDDSYTVTEDGLLEVIAPGVLGNDTDADDDPLLVTRLTDPDNGTVTLEADGSLTYEPGADFFGEASFDYQVSDGQGGTDSATVTITVSAVNDAPVAVADAYTMAEDTVLTVNAPGVLDNDTDAEDGTLAATLVDGVDHGTLALDPDGGFTYTPAANWFGTDTFTYTANDGSAASPAATVTITVTNAPDAVTYLPLAGDDRYGTAVAVSGSTFPAGSNAVIIATGLNYPDALASAGLAGVVDAPVLLVHGGERTLARDGLAIAEADRVLAGKTPKRVYIIGGTLAVSSGIESALKARYGAANVVRLGGADRYATANVVAVRMKTEMASRSIPWTGDAFVVPGLDFRDALIVGPEAYAANRPIMLYDPRGTGGLASYCASLGITRAAVSGATSGTGSVPTALALPGVTLSRIANASTAPARSVQVANWAASSLPGFGWGYVGIATADLYPDGLSAAPRQGMNAGPLLLTPSATLDATVRSALVANDAAIVEVRYFGGPVAIKAAVRSAVDSVLH